MLEKTADIWQCHHWFPCQMMSEKWAQKFHTDDASLPRSGYISASDWLNRISHAAQPIRSTTQSWVMTCHQYGISALVSQTRFGRETSGSIAKCWLFSQANNKYEFVTYTTEAVTWKMEFKITLTKTHYLP